MASTLARPRQVTFAGWMIMIGSAVVVLSAFERIAGLRSIESQESVLDFLSKPPGEDLGLSLDQVLDLIQLLSLIAGACAAAAGILGFWVLKGPSRPGSCSPFSRYPCWSPGSVTGGFVSSWSRCPR